MEGFPLSSNIKLSTSAPASLVCNQFVPSAAFRAWQVSSAASQTPEQGGTYLVESNVGDEQIFIITSRTTPPATYTIDSNLTRTYLTTSGRTFCSAFAWTLSFEILSPVMIADSAGQPVEFQCLEAVVQNLQGMQYKKRMIARACEDVSILAVYSSQLDSWQEGVWDELANSLKLNLQFTKTERLMNESQSYELPNVIPLTQLAYVAVTSPTNEWEGVVRASYSSWAISTSLNGTVQNFQLQRGEETLSIQINNFAGGDPDPRYPNGEALTHAVFDGILASGARQSTSLAPRYFLTIDGQIVWMLSYDTLIDQKQGMFGGTTTMRSCSAEFACLNMSFLIKYSTVAEKWSLETWNTVTTALVIPVKIGLV